MKNCQLSSIEDNAKLAQGWIDSGKDPKRRKDFFNCVGVPLINPDNEAEGENLTSLPSQHCIKRLLDCVLDFNTKNI